MDERKDIVLLGIGGGVAAYKAVEVASRLTQDGCHVQVAMTRAATEFVGPLSFAAVTGNAVLTDMFPEPESTEGDDLYPHLYPATEAAAMVVLPATADLISKLAAGLGGDVVTAGALSLRPSCKRLFCPSMNVEMWNQPVVQRNCDELEDLGWRRLGPDAGHLACGMTGEGRMAAPAAIVEAVHAALRSDGLLAGKRVLITSGPTVEYIDPVRFISNQSSGRMGLALAEAAVAAGAIVDVVTGPVPEAHIPKGPRISVSRVRSAVEMLAAAAPLFEHADAVVFAAAVADFTSETVADSKRPKSECSLELKLRPTPDIAAELAAGKRDEQMCVGFALETDDMLINASMKLYRKQLDAIVLNGVEAMGSEGAHYHYLTGDENSGEDWGRLSKIDCAGRLIERIARELG
jgi:phosphopantothenoylcysteine decarboxylase/phosphopantothenate--cysteine ligase